MATATMTSAPAFFGRLSWMIVGPFALAICTISITERGDGWFSPLDLIYFLVLGGDAHRAVERVPVQPAADRDGRARHCRRTCAGTSG